MQKDQMVYVDVSGTRTKWVPLWCSHRSRLPSANWLPCPKLCNAFSEVALENELQQRRNQPRKKVCGGGQGR